MHILKQYFNNFTNTQLKQYAALETLYKKWNEKINVISRRDIDSLYERHVLHSLSIATVFSFKKGTQIVDLGCGGGFPGIPLAIFFPEVQFHMVDSIAKKLKVVENVAATIGLKNITIEHCRIENITGKKFNFVISRAVAPLKDLWYWSKPLIQKKNTAHTQELAEKGLHAPGLICLKGGDLTKEISESNARVHVMPLKRFFETPFYEEKLLIYIPL